MIDEETVRVVSMLQRESLELFFKLLFKLIDRDNQRNMYSHNFKEKKSKIKSGELSSHDYKKMLKSGEKFRMVTLPKEKLPEIENYGKMLGAQYYVMEGDEHNALLAVSEKSFQQLDDAVKQSIKAQLSNDKNAVKVMDGDDLIPADQTKLAEDILTAHDIPTYTFLNPDGSCINVVPSEYSGQYRAAMQEVKETAESVKNINITIFSQLENTMRNDLRIKNISEKEAQSLAKGVGQEEIKFYKNNDKLYVGYPAKMKTNVESILNKTAENQKLIKGFETALVGSQKDYVTIDRESLEVKEVGDDLFMRIPRTMGQDYIKLPQKDFIGLNDGKTLKYSFDNEKQYEIFDADGKNIKTLSGAELAKHYEQRSERLFGGENTQSIHYDVGGREHIEIYDKANDKLYCIGNENADKLNAILLENGIDSKAAEALTEKLQAELGMNPPKEINYIEENVDNDLERTAFIEATQDMEQYGTVDESAGEKCAVYDTDRNQYTIIDTNRDDQEKIRTAFLAAGYTEFQTAAILSKISAAHPKEDILTSEIKNDMRLFDSSNNAELNNYRYAVHDGGAAIIKAEINNGEEVYKYVTAAKGTSRAEFENALRKNFCEDEKTVTDIMKSFDKEKLLPIPEQIIIPSMGYKVSLVSSQTYELSKNGITITAQKGSSDIIKTAEAFGITEKQAEKLTSKVEKAINSANQKPTFLSQLRQATAKAINVTEKDKAVPERTESGAR